MCGVVECRCIVRWLKISVRRLWRSKYSYRSSCMFTRRQQWSPGRCLPEMEIRINNGMRARTTLMPLIIAK